MEAFTLFKNLDESYNNRKEILEIVFRISLSPNPMPELDIDMIYDLALKEFPGYRIIKGLKDYGLETFPNKDLEDAMKNHCIIKALYTLEYIYQDNTPYIPISELGSTKQRYGFYELLENPTIKKDINFSKNDSNNIRNSFNSIMNKSLHPYLSQLVSTKIDNDKAYNKPYISPFLSNFTFNSILSQLKPRENRKSEARALPKEATFSFEKPIKTIVDYNSKIQKNQEQNVSDKNSRTVIESRRAAIRNYINKFQDFYNANFVCDSSNPIDQLLFYYKKEMSFHGKLIYSYFINDTPNLKNSILNTHRSIIPCTPSNTFGYENKTKIQNEYYDDICSLLKLGLNLPNVFSRSFFLRLFSFEPDSDLFSDSLCTLDYLLKVIFPIYENAFFIYFIETIKLSFSEDTLIHAKNILSKYVHDNKDNLVNNFIDESQSFNDVINYEISIPKNIVLDDQYYKLDIYSEIIIYAFLETDLNNKNTPFYVDKFEIDENQLMEIKYPDSYRTEYIQSFIGNQYYKYLNCSEIDDIYLANNIDISYLTDLYYKLLQAGIINESTLEQFYKDFLDYGR